MPSRPRLAAAVLLVATAAGLLVAVDLGYLFEETERRTVAVRDGNGTTLARVDVRVADSYAERRTGLSETASLGPNEGMLFVHDREGRHGYWMRGMTFPIDIVFVDANGTITQIFHAPAPPDGAGLGDLERYRGRGKYVLEVPLDYTDRHGIEVGDRVVVDGVRAGARPTDAGTRTGTRTRTGTTASG